MKGNSLCLVFMCNWFSIFAISYIILFKTNCRGFLTQTLVWLIDIWATIKNSYVKSILEKNRYWKKNNVPIRQVSNFNYCNIFLIWSVWKKIKYWNTRSNYHSYSCSCEYVWIILYFGWKEWFFFNRDTLLYTQGAKKGKILRCLF